MRNILGIIIILGSLSTMSTPGLSQSGQDENNLLENIKPAQIDSLVQSYEGDRAVLVNIWATWCGPCVEEFPDIVKLQKEYNDKLRVIFISADLKKDRPRVIEFLKKHKVGWTTYFKRGNDQEFIRTIDEDWSGALPFTKIYSIDGSVVDSWHDKADYETIHTHIKQALKMES